jgi:hypothetical protein
MRQLAINLAVLFIAVLLMALSGEVAFRIVDGYRLDSFVLDFKPAQQVNEADYTLQYAKTAPLAPGFDFAWYKFDPPTLAATPRQTLPPDLVQAAQKLEPGVVRNELQIMWNYDFLNQVCRTGRQLRTLLALSKNPGFVYAFKNPDGVARPEYRQFPGFQDGDIVFNQLGFRGPDIELRKPPRTIRIAFLGASTTQGIWPWSYPEFVVHDLNTWARAQGLDVTFEAINAGRSGESSSGIAAIMKYEVAPLRPDIVIYYEGANEFNPGALAQTTDAGGSRAGRWFMTLSGLPLEHYSAFANRIYELLFRRGGPQAEPAKPLHIVRFDLSQSDPDLKSGDLPFNLSRQAQDIHEAAEISRHIGATMFLSSFVFIAQDGLRLDPELHRFILHGLNVEYSPLTYAEIRQAADFQNRVFRKIADVEQIRFIDLARYFPQDPNLFFDTVHMWSPKGVRLQGWIVAQLIAPAIRDALSGGRLPTAATAAPEELSWAVTPPVKFDLSCLDKRP